MIFAIFGGLVTACLNITLGREKVNLKATIFSALINIGLNLVFIPWLSFVGAALTTAISELFVLVFCVLKTKNLADYLDVAAVRKSLMHALIGSICIAIVAYGLKLVLTPGMYRIAIIIPACILVYLLILAIFRENILFDVLKKLKTTEKE